MPPEARVGLILAKYASSGIIPLIIPSVLMDHPDPDRSHPVAAGQRPLLYPRRSLMKSGTSFTSIPARSPGMSVAYWGPEIKVGEPQKALSINMDSPTDIESVSCSFNSQGKVLPVVHIQNQ